MVTILCQSVPCQLPNEDTAGCERPLCGDEFGVATACFWPTRAGRRFAIHFTNFSEPVNSAMAMPVAFRHFILDREGALYRPPSAALDRMPQTPTRHRLPRLAGQRVRRAEVALEMMNGRPLRVVRSVFNMLTFKSDGALVPPLQDRHVRARAELALALEAPARHAGIAEASTRFVARGGQWAPSAALVRRIEQTALGRQKCPRVERR